MHNSTPLSVLSLLQAARLLLDTPITWARSAGACDINGLNVAAHAQNATSWCAIGALYRRTFSGSNHAAETATAYLRAAIPPGSLKTTVSDFNNTATHNQVLAMFDTAIERCARDYDSTQRTS